MKIKIIKNVIVAGILRAPGTKEKPMIIDAEESVADNLKRIGCGADPSAPDMETPEDPMIALAEKDALIEEMEIAIAEKDTLFEDLAPRLEFANKTIFDSTQILTEKEEMISGLLEKISVMEKQLEEKAKPDKGSKKQ